MLRLHSLRRVTLRHSTERLLSILWSLMNMWWRKKERKKTEMKSLPHKFWTPLVVHSRTEQNKEISLSLSVHLSLIPFLFLSFVFRCLLSAVSLHLAAVFLRVRQIPKRKRATTTTARKTEKWRNFDVAILPNFWLSPFPPSLDYLVIGAMLREPFLHTLYIADFIG